MVDESFDARGAYFTPDPSSQIGFSSPPQIRRPLSSIPILRPKLSGETVTIGRSSAQCTHPIPQQWLNLHISRVHVVVRYVPQTRELAVFCKGLNPIYVDTSYETKKIEKGREGRFKEGEDVKINIAGYVVIVEAPDEEDEEEEIHLEETVESLRLLPSLGPPVTATTEFVDPEKKRQGSMEFSPPAIHSPSPVAHEPHPSSPPAQPTEEIQIYRDESNTPRSSLSPPPANLASPMSRSESVSSNTSDSALLDALLTTLIFAEVKPTSLPRILFDLSHRLPNVAQSQILSVLTSTPCIGIVHRSGKDAAGKQLPDEYYYIPESISLLFYPELTVDDEDIARRERYYQFARPTRSCRLKHSQVSPSVSIRLIYSTIGDL